MARERDIRSFAAASNTMSLSEAVAYTGLSRNTIYERRFARDRAKTKEERDKAFPPEYLVVRSPMFKRDEIDAWFAAQRRGEG